MDGDILAGMKYIGIDYGTKRVGIATSDDGGTMAFPKIVVPTEQAAVFVRMFVENEKKNGSTIGGIVCGESKGNDGEENEVMGAARQFASRIGAQLGVPIFWEWEGYSSAMAKNAGHEGRARGDIARKTARAFEVVDASAAAVVLQSFLDKNTPHR